MLPTLSVDCSGPQSEPSASPCGPCNNRSSAVQCVHKSWVDCPCTTYVHTWLPLCYISGTAGSIVFKSGVWLGIFYVVNSYPRSPPLPLPPPLLRRGVFTGSAGKVVRKGDLFWRCTACTLHKLLCNNNYTGNHICIMKVTCSAN